MKKNTKGFSLVLAMGVTLIMSLLAFTILEYMIPFSKNVKGIENSSKAFYKSTNGIENALYAMKGQEAGYESGTTLSSTDSISDAFNIIATGSIIPPIGLGNSEYNKNYNKISKSSPIQLEVGKNMIPKDYWNGKADFYFKVPDLDMDNASGDETLSGSYIPIINWQLSSKNDVLNASGSYIKEDKICDSDNTTCKIKFYDRDGLDNNGNGYKFQNFYENNCKNSGSGCILKLSIINKLETDDGVILPYLEWKIKLDSSLKIPLRYARLNGEGKAIGFKKDLNVKVAQQTINEAFDFTVLQ